MEENLFKWKHFESNLILLCVRWYLKYPLSYRNLAEMIAGRGLSIALTTIMRWVFQYAPILNKRLVSQICSSPEYILRFDLSFLVNIYCCCLASIFPPCTHMIIQKGTLIFSMHSKFSLPLI